LTLDRCRKEFLNQDCAVVGQRNFWISQILEIYGFTLEIVKKHAKY